MNPLSQVSSPMILIPAYGRSYSTKASMLADWNSGKDFKILNGPYCSVKDIEGLRDMASTITLQDLRYNISVQV